MLPITIADLLTTETGERAARLKLKAEAYGRTRTAVIANKQRELGGVSADVVRRLEGLFGEGLSDLMAADVTNDPCFPRYADAVVRVLDQDRIGGLSEQQRARLCALGNVVLTTYWYWTPTITSSGPPMPGSHLQSSVSPSGESVWSATERERFDDVRQTSPILREAFSLERLFRQGFAPAIGRSQERSPLLRFLWRRHQRQTGSRIEVVDDEDDDLSCDLLWESVYTTHYIDSNGGRTAVAKSWHDQLTGRMAPCISDLCDPASCQIAIGDEDARLLADVLFVQHLFTTTRHHLANDGKRAATLLRNLMSIPYPFAVITG